MKAVYPVIFTDVDTNILIEVSDLGILTEANEEGKKKGTIADAIVMARDAIGINALQLEDEGKELPKPFSKAIEKEEGDIVRLVDVDIAEYRKKQDNRMVKKNCTIPYYLNVEAEKAGINFSRLLQDAIKEKLCC